MKKTHAIPSLLQLCDKNASFSWRALGFIPLEQIAEATEHLAAAFPAELQPILD